MQPLWRSLRDRAQTDDEARAAVELIAGFRAAARDRTPFDLYAGLLNRLDANGLTMRQRFLTRLGGEAADALDAFLDQAQAAEMRGVMDLCLWRVEPELARAAIEGTGQFFDWFCGLQPGLAEKFSVGGYIFDMPNGQKGPELEGSAPGTGAGRQTI